MEESALHHSLEPIIIASTAQEVYRRLKQAILDGDLPPGSRLVERILAEKLEVSRTPVREALKSLSAEGLVMVDGHRGLIVARLSMVNVEQAYILRETLEGLAARLASMEQKRTLLEQLSQSLGVMEMEVVDPDVFDRAHSSFHDTMTEMAQNSYLTQCLKGLEGFRTRMVSLNWVTKTRVATSVPEHRKIYQAILERNPELAEQYAREHVRRTREGLIKRIQGMDHESSPP